MTNAFIGRVADIAKATPNMMDVPANPPGPGMSRLRCFFFFKYGDPAKFYYSRIQTWWMESLRGSYYDMDKEYSRTTSELVIPQLINEINVLREPQQAGERFKLMASGLDVSSTPMEEAEEDGNELLT